MISAAPLLTALTLLLGSWSVGSATTKALARRRGLEVAWVALICSLLGVVLTALVPDAVLPVSTHSLRLVGSRHVMIAAAVNALVGFVAVSLSPRPTHQPHTYGRILALVGIGEIFLAASEPLTLAFLWLASVYITQKELNSHLHLRDEARLFTIYQVPSTALFLLGAVLYVVGWPEWAALPILAGVACREAVLPFHGWFIRFVEKAPMGLVVAFVAPQLGVYTHLELLHHQLSPEVAHFVATVGAVSALFGAFMALGQTKVRRAAGYLMMSEMSLVAFGLENFSSVGWSGAVLAWLVAALGVSAFLLCISAVSARRGELVFGSSAGSPAQMPHLSAATLLAGLATVGAPFTLGFIAEDLLVQGSITEHPILGLGLIVVTALNGITVLRIYFGLFTAGPHRPGERDVERGEFLTLSVVLGLLLLGGLFPGALVMWIQ